MAKSLAKDTSYSFPRGPMPIGKAVEEAEAALEVDYKNDVDGVVAELKEKVEKGEASDSGALDKALEAAIGKHRRTRSTRWAMLGLIVSENADAAYDEDIEVPVEDSPPWTFLSYYAFRRDVIDGLDAVGVDTDGLGESEGEPANDDDEDDDE